MAGSFFDINPGSGAQSFSGFDLKKPGMSVINAPPAPASSGIGFGGLLSVASIIGNEIFAGINRKKAAKREMKAAQFTGQSLLGQAADIETVSGLEELEFREQSQRELASIESLYADAGIAPTGSVLEVLLASKRRLETDALKIRETGRKQAESSREQAGQAFQQAEHAKDAAKHSFFGLF